MFFRILDRLLGYFRMFVVANLVIKSQYWALYFFVCLANSNNVVVVDCVHFAFVYFYFHLNVTVGPNYITNTE
jgi:hypothetical protein